MRALQSNQYSGPIRDISACFASLPGTAVCGSRAPSPSMRLPTLVCGLALLLASIAPAGAAPVSDLSEVTRLHHAGQSPAALARADRVLAARPKDAQMRFLKSVILADTGQRDQAAEMLRQLVQDFPELAEPHNNLAALHAAAGEYGKARAELEETLRLNPAFAPAHENLGDIHVLLAGQSYARALVIEPSSATLPKKLAMVRRLDGASAASAVPLSPR
ncbi:MAG: tetratricopeptide repeat protein [Burkholderiaceae bacterium]